MEIYNLVLKNFASPTMALKVLKMILELLELYIYECFLYRLLSDFDDLYWCVLVYSHNYNACNIIEIIVDNSNDDYFEVCEKHQPIHHEAEPYRIQNTEHTLI